MAKNSDTVNDWMLDLLVLYLQETPTPFRAEHFRIWCGMTVVPPRFYGPLMRRAQKHGLIKAVGYDKVINPNAHSAIVTLWQRT